MAAWHGAAADPSISDPVLQKSEVWVAYHWWCVAAALVQTALEQQILQPARVKGRLLVALSCLHAC